MKPNSRVVKNINNLKRIIDIQLSSNFLSLNELVTYKDKQAIKLIKLIAKLENIKVSTKVAKETLGYYKEISKAKTLGKLERKVKDIKEWLFEKFSIAIRTIDNLKIKLNLAVKNIIDFIKTTFMTILRN